MKASTQYRIARDNYVPIDGQFTVIGSVAESGRPAVLRRVQTEELSSG